MRRRDFFKKTQQKRYESHSFRNPYFREKKNLTHLRWLGGISAFFVISLGLGLFFYVHPKFNISEVRINGIQHLDKGQISQTIRDELNKRVYLFFKRQNRFLFDKDQLFSELNSQFTFRDLQINQNGTEIFIQAVERTSQFIWKTNNQFFVVDLEGVIIREINSEEQEYLLSIFPVFVDRNNVTISIGDQVLKREETEAIIKFHEYLQSQQIGIIQTEFDRLLGKWVGVLTSNSYHILFDPVGDITTQADRLRVILRDKISDPNSLEYIDLRFGDHVYFK